MGPNASSSLSSIPLPIPSIPNFSLLTYLSNLFRTQSNSFLLSILALVSPTTFFLFLQYASTNQTISVPLLFRECMAVTVQSFVPRSEDSSKDGQHAGRCLNSSLPCQLSWSKTLTAPLWTASTSQQRMLESDPDTGPENIQLGRQSLADSEAG